MDNNIDCKSNSSNLISGNSFWFLVFHSNTNQQTTKLVWYSWTINCVTVYKRETTKIRLTLMVLTVCCCLFSVKEYSVSLYQIGKAFRKLISVNRGERIHNNSLGNDEVPDGVRELLPLCEKKLSLVLLIYFFKCWKISEWWRDVEIYSKNLRKYFSQVQ